MKTLSLVVAVAALACGADAGTLDITVNPLPVFVKDADVLISGSVTRTPAKATDIIISVAGGAAAAADTFRGNSYTVRVLLTPNATNSLVVTATDKTGSTANSVNLTIRQDGTGPTVALVTPADTTDNVPLAAPVTVKFSEPVVIASGGGIQLRRQGALVTGTTTRSADSLTLTFAPSAPLSPNAIYRLTFSGITDVAANTATPNFGACFATTPTGATATSAFADSAAEGFFGAGSNPGLLPPDLVSVRFAREGTFFSGVFRFNGPRVFSATALNQGGVILELDTDRDSTTGFWAYKDTLFYASPTFSPDYATKYSSGTKIEYVIDLEPALIGDSAFVGRKNGAFDAFIDGAFVPGVCGAMMSFVVPFSVLGNDDGQMNAVALGIAGTSVPSAFLIDPMPIFRSLAADVRVPGPAPVWNGAAFIAEYARPRLVRLRARPPLR